MSLRRLPQPRARPLAVRLSKETGAPAEDFAYNKLSFEQLIGRDLHPTASVFFAGDGGDPGGLGQAVSEALKKNNIASLVIDQPPGFKGGLRCGFRCSTIDIEHALLSHS
jgi:hypothetical protein